MTEKLLGKIVSAEYGKVKDYPFLFGLQLTFAMDGYRVSDGGKYVVNISKQCKWVTANRAETITHKTELVYDILNSAKVNSVSELVGKPVEVTIEDNVFKDFRILTEVL